MNIRIIHTDLITGGTTVKLLKIFLFLITLILWTSVSIAAPTGDDFNDGITNAAWGTDILLEGSNAVLTEANGHLEFTGSNSGIIRPWQAGFGSYTQNWEAAVDVNLGAITLPQNNEIEMFLAVANAAEAMVGNMGDHFSISLGIETSPDATRRWYTTSAAVNNTDLTGAPNYAEISTADQTGRLRIAFDASVKTLTASYNGTPLGSLDVDDSSSDWGVTSPGFLIALGGSMWGDFTNSSTQVYVDNFQLRSGNSLSYLLTVNNGTGSGEYTNGASVNISASNAPAGQVFDCWTGSTQYLANALSADTVVTLPAQAVAFTPAYKLDGTASGDDFDDNLKNTAKWGNDQYFSAATNMTLQEVNGRLEILKQSGQDAFGIFRPWIESTGSYTQDWETAVDLHLGNISLDSGTWVNINLAVANQDDATFGDALSIALDLYSDEDGIARGYEMIAKTNGSDLASAPNYGYASTADTDGRVKIAFSASTKTLTASFNGTVLGSMDVDDPSSNWEMTTGSVFGVAIAGSVGGTSVGLSSGDMSADNFSITFPAAAEFLCTTNGGQITITAYIGSGGSVDIPVAIDGLPVVAIGDGAFSSCVNVTSISVPAGVISVGSLAFSSCTALKAVCFSGDSPIFGASVFSGTSGVLAYRLAGSAGWVDTLDAVEVKTVYPVAEQGLTMSCGFDGTHYLTGIENQQTSPPTLEAQFLSADGTQIGSPLSTGRTGMSTALAFDGTNYLMVWEDDGLGTLTNGSYQIYGQFISPAGTAVDSPFAVSTPGVWYDGIRVMAYGSGKYLVTYTRLINPDNGDESTNRYIAGCMVDPSGSVDSEFRISTGYGQESDVAFDGSNFFVVWCEDQYDQDIRGRFVSPSGIPGTEISVNASIAPSDNPKSVAFDGKNYLVVWNDETGGADTGTWDAFGQFVSTNGTLVGGVITLVDDAGPQMVTGIAFDGFNYLSVWSDMSTDGDWDLYGQYINASGALVGGRIPLMNCGGNQLGGVGYANAQYIVLVNDGVIMGSNGVDAVDGSYALFITPSSDSDSDQLPDTWEQQYFGSAGASPTNTCANEINTVLDAYIAGIDPTDPQDFFGITGGNARTGALQWNAVSGRVYAVYWSTNLITGFQCLESNILWNAGTFTDNVHRAESKCFYKLDVRLQ